MMMAAQGGTKPLAGVIATRPATRPEAKPKEVGRPCFIHSAISQAMPPAAAAIWVVVKARAAPLPALTAEPPLKPNQPNQSMPAPRRVSTRELGCRTLVG